MFGINDFGKFVDKMRVYLFGRGIISLGVILATFALPALGFQLTFLPALIIAGGGAALNSLLRLHDQGVYEQEMVDLYRNDIARHVGKAPEEVSRADLKEAALHNDVIDQALKRQRQKNIVGFATSALAGLTTFGLLYVGLAGTVTTFFQEHFTHTVANVLQYASAGVVSSISGLIVHDGLEAAIGVSAGLYKAGAHDRIMEMERDVARGISITPEQVYGVLVASDAALAQRIRDAHNEPYNRMNTQRQHKVLQDSGAAQDMMTLAVAINAGRIRPGHLAYITGDSCINERGEPTPDGKPCVPFIEDRSPKMHAAAHNYVERINAERHAQLLAGVQR